MCLLITQPEGFTFSDDMLLDFFTSNRDGIGVMYVENGMLVVEKSLPNSAAQAAEFYKTHAAGKACAIHYRMMTHGDIDLLNCHPYKVFSKDEDGVDMWLMHNGILHTGNAKDKAKSDTWHYINDVIRPMLRGRTEEFTSEWFRYVVEDHIGGSNKFVMMDSNGTVATFNEKSGVYYEDAWMSNTYAWSAAKYIPGLAKKTKWWSGYTAGGYADNDYSYASSFASSRKWWEKDGDIDTPVVAEDDDEDTDYYASVEEDARAFVDEFYDVIEDLKFDRALVWIDVSEVEDFYYEDQDEAVQFLLDLEDGNYSQNDVLALFDARASSPQEKLAVGMV